MCRLAIFGGGVDFRTASRGLSQLEQSMGGDGNGMYMPERNDLWKEVSLSTGEIALEASEAEGMTMFHTRLSTAGGIDDEICHPFPAGEYVLMHNGHFHGWLDYVKHERSDTETVARIVGERGPGVLLSKKFDFSGTFIVHDGKGALVIPTGNYPFLFQWREDGSFFHASEYIDEFDADTVEAAVQGAVYRVWPDGSVKRVKIKTARMPRRNKKKSGPKIRKPLAKAMPKLTRQDWERWAWLAEMDDSGHALQDWEKEELSRLDAALEKEDWWEGIQKTAWESFDNEDQEGGK